MKSWQNRIDDACNFDDGVEVRLNPNPTTLFPPCARENLGFYDDAVEEIENINFQSGKLNADSHMGYLQMTSSEEDDPNDTSVGSNSSASKKHRKDEVPPPINVQEVWMTNTFPSQHVGTQESIGDFDLI
ncbi:unnamed protein product [Fraxinus pennsylvanica]|uniref:Uncharacterized protein n=1 Tax=Fraxinus pennsylvanica TaxID=56036 RepID=A0AAD2DUM2_9LAMI|nr:unnamed protein product [Fraxinus pennsylvanica]